MTAFCKHTSEVFVPDGCAAKEALSRTTHLGIGAHQDDLEIMALDGILAGFGTDERWFTGTVASDGAGSPRDGIYSHYTDAEMRAVRRREQKKAAVVGEFSAAVFLDHTSASLKDPASREPTEDLATLVRACRPEIVYTHNLADKHPTHVAVAVRVVDAIRTLAADERPARLYGCEVWRDLDWMVDADKVCLNLDQHESIAAALVGVYDSQVAGGKRYDLATMGRRRAHATYHESHSVDAVGLMSFAMDLTPLVADTSLSIADFVAGKIERFSEAVRAHLSKFG